jgi:hypothetical protein
MPTRAVESEDKTQAQARNQATATAKLADAPLRRLSTGICLALMTCWYVSSNNGTKLSVRESMSGCSCVSMHHVQDT